jgi:uncharacterized phage-associated protein
MKQLAFCEYCMTENKYKVRKANKISILVNEEITYTAKEAICSICENEIFVSEICDCNLENLYNEYRKKHNIIGVKEIKHILINYSVDKKALSLLLGWKSETINRYLNGDIAETSHSEILKKIYENPSYYSILLQTNKERIEPISYSKSRQAVKDILSEKAIEDKIDAVIKYILIRCEDFTPYYLQNLLYYVQAFFYVFTKSFIFEEDCRAYTSGPVYESVFKRYEKFGFEEVNKSILANKNLRLEDVERNVVEGVIKFYGCYSGKVLKQMTHNEAPWILTRAAVNNKNEFEIDDSNMIIDKSLISEYFDGIREKYNMINLLDIKKYSMDLFDKISM